MMLVLPVVLVTAVFRLAESQGTTDNIKEVFEGRCWDYDVTRYQNLLPRVETDCSDLWKEFSTAFSYRKPCDVTENRYKRFLDLAKQALPVDKVLFWSGVYNLAHQFSANGARYITLEDTMIGYLANSLHWCGQVSPPGMNFSQCPGWTECPTEASESFWAGASTTFASQAEGEVTLILDGSNPDKPAYRRDSFFGKFELPNLNVDKVTSVNVVVAHALAKPKIETCGTGSLVALQQDVEARGLDYFCEEDPEILIFLQCADEPKSSECQMPDNSA
jgi:hypothetical protein